MTKAEILKREILRQYRSVRQFALEMNIPYSTLVTALERGIEGMAYGTVIRMCDKLSLNPVDFKESNLEVLNFIWHKTTHERRIHNFKYLIKSTPSI